MNSLLFSVQQNGVNLLQWLDQNPFAVILIMTFILLALASAFGGHSSDDSQSKAAKEPTQPPKSVAEVIQESKVKESQKSEPEVTSKPKKEEPKKDKPKKTDSKKADPKKDKPKEESKKAEPKKAEPKKAEPKKAEPKKDEPKKAEPKKAEPKKAEPKKAEPKKAEPKKAEPSSEDEEARQKKLEERQKKRTQHVSEIEIQEEAVEPRTLREGLGKTRGGWISKLGTLLRGKGEIDDDVLEEIEEVLYSADIGTRTVQRLLQTIEDKLERDELTDPSAVKESIKDEIYKIINIESEPLTFTAEGEDTFVTMIVGVNGVGKTTTIGKVAARLNRQGKKVLVGAADTFRAAAVEQLELWAERTDAVIVRGQPNQDPSSVVFDSVQAGVAREMDVVLVDTAGRLHTKNNLMEELKKIKRVMARAHSTAPHEILLVLDAMTGQNAINQAKKFHEALGVTGIVLTKLDGSSKGGVVVAICEELKIPIRFIGVGEHIDELRTFSSSEFVDALFED